MIEELSIKKHRFPPLFHLFVPGSTEFMHIFPMQLWMVLIDNILHEYSCPDIWIHILFFFSELIGALPFHCSFSFPAFYSFTDRRNSSLSVYRHKLKNRGRSILLPYLFWNLMIHFIFILIQTIPGLSSSTNQLMDMYSLTDWLDAFWSTNGGCPICYQFWFLRDLIVMILFPLIYISCEILPLV